MFPLLFRFFIYSNLFIAVCAVLMTEQAFYCMLQQPADPYLLAFVFFSTLCSYSFHWYLTPTGIAHSPRLQWMQTYRKLHLLLMIIGAVGSAVFFFYLLPYWHWLGLAALITFLYSAPKIPNKYFRALRKVALGKTIFLAFMWMFVTTVLPLIVSETAWTTSMVLFIVSRFFLIHAICILFDYRDREDDKSAGIRSLITYLSENRITYLFICSISLHLLSSAGLLYYGYDLVSVILLIIPGIITAGLYSHARKNFSDMLYYFILDGLMALSAVLMWIQRI